MRMEERKKKSNKNVYDYMVYYVKIYHLHQNEQSR